MPEQLVYGPKSDPRSRRCVAKECRNEWQVTRFVIPDRIAALRTARCIVLSCR